MVVVRESNGILRHADHEEREKMLNIYLHHDRPNYTPKMFDPINLEVRLENYLGELDLQVKLKAFFYY